MYRWFFNAISWLVFGGGIGGLTRDSLKIGEFSAGGPA